MSLDELPAREANRRDMHEAMRRQHEDDLARQRDAYEEQALIESPEAEELRWAAIFRAQAADTVMEQVRYPHPTGIDRRLHGADLP